MLEQNFVISAWHAAQCLPVPAGAGAASSAAKVAVAPRQRPRPRHSEASVVLVGMKILMLRRGKIASASHADSKHAPR